MGYSMRSRYMLRCPWEGALTNRNRSYEFLLVIFVILVIKTCLDSWQASGREGGALLTEVDVQATVQCQETSGDLLDLAERVHLVFGALRISYFLTYRSLAAALYTRNPLPWDNVLEVGVLRRTNSYSLSELRRVFAFHRVTLDYDSHAGAFTLQKGAASAVCYEYYDYYWTGVVHRTGWESYYKWPTYRLKHSISPIHVVQPLANVEFGGLNLSAPHNAHGLLSQFYSEGGFHVIKQQVNICKGIGSL